MSTEVKREVRSEIAHVLFVDIVGYSKLLINEQHALLGTAESNRSRPQEFQTAETAGRLIKIPTGDGMALVFYSSPEDPVECAMEISRAVKEHPELRLRMGVHSGPVSSVIDVNERANVAGVGINMAQRVMDCGDAGHILLSKRVAEDLGQYAHCSPISMNSANAKSNTAYFLSRSSILHERSWEPGIPRKSSRIARAKKEKASRGSLPKWAWISATASLSRHGSLVFVSKRSGKTNGASISSDSEMPAGPIPEKSIAVLPFENLSSDKENAYFADGVQDEILTDLARIADLKVISRTSVMHIQDWSATQSPRDWSAARCRALTRRQRATGR